VGTAPDLEMGGQERSRRWSGGCRQGCPRQDSNLRTRLRRPVKLADSAVPTVLSRLGGGLSTLERRRLALVRPTNRSTTAQIRPTLAPVTFCWKAALNAFAITFGGRIVPSGLN
jgi:hypothetical protein